MEKNTLSEEKAKELISKGLLLSPSFDEEKIEDDIEETDDLLVLNEDSLSLLKKETNLDWKQLERLRSQYEKGDKTSYKKYVDHYLNGEKNNIDNDLSYNKVTVENSYDKESHEREVNDFVQHFRKRYDQMEKILRQRPEMKDVISIKRAQRKNYKEDATIIGMVREKRETQNDNLLLKVEDPTGEINVLINKNKPDLFEKGRNIVKDEVIGWRGSCGDNIIFINEFYRPGIPYNNQMKTSDEEVYLAFLSDLHIGSKDFLNEEFNEFLKWINGETGDEEQKKIAEKIKYILIPGDIVDSVGVYPDQDEELDIPDVYEQFEKAAELLSQIPQDIEIIISPGNHDPGRRAEPQPALNKKFAEPLYELPNTTLVSNPARIKIKPSEDSPSFNILMYHGFSFDHYISNVDKLRNNGGYERADLVMKFLLERRHLAPQYESTPRLPDTEEDPLTISNIPDIFVTGHIHYSNVANYKNITMVCGSSWQGMTSFQEKLGHNPEPGRLPIINLKTRDAKVLKFKE